MRKRTINHLADTIFWYLLYFFPVIAYLLFLFVEPGTATSIVDLPTFFNQVGFGIVTDNVIINALRDIFGANGILPFFNTDMPLLIFTWYITVFITHLAVDFILFIPRLCHKWMKSFTQGE